LGKRTIPGEGWRDHAPTRAVPRSAGPSAGRLILAAALLCGVGFAGEAQAQGARTTFFARPSPASPIEGFFSMLFGGMRAAPPRPAFNQPSLAPLPELREGGSGGYVAAGFCVRTCDGRYFPLQGRPNGAGDPDALAQCNAFCPAARMAVYTTSDTARGIDLAVSRDGAPYSEMPNAYVYRQRLVDGCTCTGGPRIGGLAKIDVMRDPTLKRGDVVMSRDGSRVFAGAGTKVAARSGAGGGMPYQKADFVTPAQFPELPRDMRARLDELTVASR